MKSLKLDNPIKAPDESKDPYDVWFRSPTSTNMNTLLTHVGPTINSALTTHVRGNVSPVARARARLLAVGAIKTYDPLRGASLKSHLMTQLQPLSRYSMQAVQPMKMSERRLRQASALEKTEREFWDRHGRDPSDIELADDLGLSVTRIGKIRAYGQPTISTETTVPGGEDPITNRPDPMDVWIDYVYHDLGPIDRKILDFKLGRGGQPTLRNIEIARRLKISPSAVSQRAAHIQAKLLEGAGVST